MTTGIKAADLFRELNYEQVKDKEFSGYIFEREEDGYLTRIYVFFNGMVTKSYFNEKTEDWEASGTLLYEELVSIYQLHREMNL